jgi:3-oxoacyl-[acyl-carrier protein] reductase
VGFCVGNQSEVKILDGQGFSSRHEAVRRRIYPPNVFKRRRVPAQASLAYSAAQAGVAVLARNLAQQLGQQGIRVNAIAPSAIRNERMQRSMSAEQQDNLAKTFAIHRIGEPQDVAAAALFLCSESSSWITGVTLDVAGGKVMV